MPFDLNSIPTAVKSLFEAGTWKPAIATASALGITNSNTLADIVFFLRHPERHGKFIAKTESLLVAEWMDIQAEIEKLLEHIPIEFPPGPGPVWHQIAKAEEKRWSRALESTKDWDEHYFMAAPYFGAKNHSDGSTPKIGSNIHWCAAFVNWCLHRAGYSHTGNGSNRSFRKRSNWFFNALEEPKKGCVILLGHTQAGTRSNHVAFLESWKKLPTGRKVNSFWVSGAKRISLLGGNQDDTVKVKPYYKKKIFAATGVNGVTSPYLWPLRGPNTCSISSVSSLSGHHCGCNPNPATSP